MFWKTRSQEYFQTYKKCWKLSRTSSVQENNFCALSLRGKIISAHWATAGESFFFFYSGITANCFMVRFWVHGGIDSIKNQTKKSNPTVPLVFKLGNLELFCLSKISECDEASFLSQNKAFGLNHRSSLTPGRLKKWICI